MFCSHMLSLASYLVSCEEAKLLYPLLDEMAMYIDIDDSGPLNPFPVVCVFQGKATSLVFQNRLLYIVCCTPTPQNHVVLYLNLYLILYDIWCITSAAYIHADIIFCINTTASRSFRPRPIC